MLFFFPGKLKADELVRHNQNDNSRARSIIRHYTSNVDIVCDRIPFGPTFTMYEEGNPNVNRLYVEMSDVTDFEIHRNTVYFCGIWNNGNKTIARIGFFDTTGFSSATSLQVYYFDLPWLTELRALEVADFVMQKHLVVIGKGIEEEPTIVDFIDEGTYWKVNSTMIYNDTLCLTDLAITESYVVVTSSMIKSPSKEGVLWYFNTPTTAGESILQTGSVFHYYLGPNFSENFFVRTISGDSFVTVHTPWSQPVGTAEYNVMKYSAMGYSRQCFLTETNISYSCLQDFFVEDENPSIPCVHLLINTEYQNGIQQSVVYELPIFDWNGTLNVYGHSYDNVFATSLRRRWDGQHFIMSGFGCTNGNPHILKYKKGFYEGCLPMVENTMEKRLVFYVAKKTDFPRAIGGQIPYPREQSMKMMQVKDDCTTLKDGKIEKQY